MNKLLPAVALVFIVGCQTPTAPSAPQEFVNQSFVPEPEPTVDPTPEPSPEPTPSPSPTPSPTPSPEPSPSPSPSPSPDLSQWPYNLNGLYMYRDTKCGSSVLISIHTEPSLMYMYKEVIDNEVRTKQQTYTDQGTYCSVKVTRVATLAASSGHWEETYQYNQSFANSCITPQVEYVSGQGETWDYETVGNELIFVGMGTCDANGNRLKMHYDRVQ